MVKRRVAIALSGGVDSSVAALLLQQAGHEVIGLTMRLWPEEKAGVEHCLYPEQNLEDAGQVCLALDIPLHIVPLEAEFKRHVIDYLCREYVQGRTPNPCIACNRDLKFGLLLERARSLGADYMATGHYARVEYFDGGYHLLKGIDPGKDQSYMLYTLDQATLAHLVFPLGHYLKLQTLELARRHGLPTAGKTSSQDICFVRTGYGSFLGECSATIPGDIIDRHGEVVGRHRGAALYTVGQRRGLGLASGRRLYVTGIESGTNRITVGEEDEAYRPGLTAGSVNWVSGRAPAGPIKVRARIRYRSPEVTATIHPEPGSARVEFGQPQRATAPGQAVVFYQDSEVIGGGTIEK